MFCGGVYHSQFKILEEGIRKTDGGIPPAPSPSQALFATVWKDWALALTKQKVAGTMKLLRNNPLVPEWRNWQTRQVQDLVLAREWRFESSFGHQYPSSKLTPKTPAKCPCNSCRGAVADTAGSPPFRIGLHGRIIGRENNSYGRRSHSPLCTGLEPSAGIYMDK